MSKYGGRLLAVIALLAIYLLTLGSLDLWDIAIGLLLAITMELGWRRRMARGGTLGSNTSDGSHRAPLHQALLAAPRLLFEVFLEITRGTWQVAKFSLGVEPVVYDGTVEIELQGLSEEGVATWAFITTISPGELAVDIDEERGLLVIHTLDARNPEQIRANHREFYDRYQRKVIP